MRGGGAGHSGSRLSALTLPGAGSLAAGQTHYSGELLLPNSVSTLPTALRCVPVQARVRHSGAALALPLHEVKFPTRLYRGPEPLALPAAGEEPDCPGRSALRSAPLRLNLTGGKRPLPRPHHLSTQGLFPTRHRLPPGR